MADRMAGEIFIGGNISRNLLPDFFKTLAAQFVTLEWGDAQFCPETAEDLLDNCTDREGVIVLRLCDDEAPYGAFESLEAFLREHDIPYDRYSDGRYEYDPLWACFRPGHDLCEFTTNTCRERLFSESLLVKIAAQLEQALGRFGAQQTTRGITTVRAAQRRLRATMATNYRPLPPFQLIGEAVVDATDNYPILPP